MKGNIITMDALHCTEETILTTVDKGANLLVGVKDNSRHLKKAIIDRFDKAGESETSTDTNFDKGHGRVETRITQITSINTKSTNFSHLKTIAKSIRKREIMRNGQLIKTQNETAYYASTIEFNKTSANDMANLIRGHWSIENKLHHTKDVSMNEDRYKAANGLARIMTGIRSCASLILGKLGPSVPIAQRKFATKTSLFTQILKCKSLSKFSLLFLG